MSYQELCHRLKIPALILLLVGVAFYTGYKRGQIVQAGDSTARGRIVRDTNNPWQHINPILECDIIGGNERIAEYQPIKEQLESEVSTLISHHEADAISIYLRTMNTGRWIGVNEDAKFSPASLLKTATLMAYLKLAEQNAEILNKKIYYAGAVDYDAAESITPAQTLVSGQEYTIQELLDSMIVHSSNNARHLLNDYLNDSYPHAQQNLYDDLNIPIPKNEDEIDFMSTKVYSSLFRTLYNATYLSQPMSEKALDLLGQVDYKNGLVAGVPTSTFIAHKFGERTIADPAGNVSGREFHDCGIVYYPAHPYLLCIMTKGQDFATLQKTVATLSHTTYTEMDTYFKARTPAPSSTGP